MTLQALPVTYTGTRGCLMFDPDAIARAEEIRLAAYVETYGENAGIRMANIPDLLHDTMLRRFADALSERGGDDVMLIQAPKTGDWFRPGRVLRVQVDADRTSVHIVTDDGAQMTVPTANDGAPADDPIELRDQIARKIIGGM